MIKILLILISLNSNANDSLKNFLIEKGIINKDEYESYLNKEEKKDLETKGLFTFRYFRQQNIYQIHRDIFLIQTKLELSKNIDKNLKLTIGFATGDKSKPRSNFESLTGGFANKNINLSLANLMFNKKNFNFVIGKFQNNIWASNSSLIDSDITFEGASFELKNKNIWFIYNPLLMQEFSITDKDPKLNIVQFGLDFKYTKFALTYYDFMYIKNTSTSTFISRPQSPYILSNSEVNSKYKYDYNILATDIKMEIPISNLMSFIYYANIGKNITISKNSDFIIYGFELSKKKNDFKFLSFAFSYRKLENDSFLDILPDISNYGGSTGIKSSRILITLNLTKNISLIPYYIYSKPNNKNQKNEKVFIFDTNFKF
ncbi:MAG: putative porin [Elusimicrobiales bacterium]|nr:putative porin [Elusimicrobiales bacterium]